MLRAFSALPAERLGRNVACVTNAVHRAQVTLQTLTPNEKRLQAENGIRALLEKSGLFTESEVASLEMTPEMIRKLLESGLLTDEQRQFLNTKLLLMSGLLTNSMCKLLESGGKLTDEMIQKLLKSGLLTEEQIRLLKLAGVNVSNLLVEKQLTERSPSIINASEKELKSEFLNKVSSTKGDAREIKRLSENRQSFKGQGKEKLIKSELLAEPEKQLSEETKQKLHDGKDIQRRSITSAEIKGDKKKEMSDIEKAEGNKENDEGDKGKDQTNKESKEIEQREVNERNEKEKKETEAEEGKVKSNSKDQILRKNKDVEKKEGQKSSRERRESKELRRKTEKDNERDDGLKSARSEKQTGKPRKGPPQIPCSFSYRLSDPLFLSLGWTKLPTEEIMFEKCIYAASLCRIRDPIFGWQPDRYKNGVPFTERFNDGRELLRYPNGDIAIEYSYNNKTKNGRFVVYTSGPQDQTIIAIFDTMGNGLVYDAFGNIRLSYCQTGGTLYEGSSGCRKHHEIKWNWLSDLKPRSFVVYKDTNLPYTFKAPKAKVYVIKAEKPKPKSAVTVKSSAKSAKSDKTSKKSEKSNKSSKKSKSEGKTSKITEEVIVPKKAIEPPKLDKKALAIIEKHTIIQPAPKSIMKFSNVLTPLRPFTMRLNSWFSLRVIDQKNIALKMLNHDFEYHINLGVDVNDKIVLSKELVNSERLVPGSVPLTEAVVPKTLSITKICADLKKNKFVIQQERLRKERVKGIPAPIFPPFNMIRT